MRGGPPVTSAASRACRDVGEKLFGACGYSADLQLKEKKESRTMSEQAVWTEAFMTAPSKPASLD